MNRVIAIVGPTAVGKTRISIDLALRLNTEIISGDSMLVYKRMNIGTAKPSMDERQGIFHHLIDFLDPVDEFNVAEFQRLADYLITDINHKGKIPILAGGTGLYVKALLEGYQFNVASGNEQLRNQFIMQADQYGIDYLYTLLESTVPEAAARIHRHDLRRIVRALEVYHTSGETISCHKANTLIYDAVVIGLITERANLYERINQRVDAMITSGLVEEVTALLKSGVPPDCQAMQGIGYKEIAQFLEGTVNLATAVENIKKTTRNFAKRQLTWFKKMPYIQWYNIDEYPNYEIFLEYIYRHVAEKFFLK